MFFFITHHKPPEAHLTFTHSSATFCIVKMAAFKYCILALALIGAASASRLELNGITEVLQPTKCLACCVVLAAGLDSRRCPQLSRSKSGMGIAWPCLACVHVSRHRGLYYKFCVVRVSCYLCTYCLTPYRRRCWWVTGSLVMVKDGRLLITSCIDTRFVECVKVHREGYCADDTVSIGWGRICFTCALWRPRR